MFKNFTFPFKRAWLVFLHQGEKITLKLGKYFFWTATINNWQRLLESKEYKKIVIKLNA